jgi:S-adenosyl-L-methionine hydrolase (adenosine-forming)
LTQIITLTTDFGTKDGYVGQMKGVILGMAENSTVIDITHDIEPFQTLQAALVISELLKYFPKRTVHLVIVDPGVGGPRRGMVLKSGDQYLVGPDNGLFSLVIKEGPWEARSIENSRWFRPNPHPTFHGRDVFAPVAAHLSKGVGFDFIGPWLRDPVTLAIPEPNQSANEIAGEVIYLDRFGNLCTNIKDKSITEPTPAVVIKSLIINKISSYFGAVPIGEPVAVINSFGFLEIAVNQGNAAKLLDADVGVPVVVRRRKALR